MKHATLKFTAVLSVLLSGFQMAALTWDCQAAEAKTKQNAAGETVVFDARGTELTGETLRDLPALKDLKLDGAQVTDATLGTLGSFSNLTSLALDKTGITDATLADQVAKLPKLQQLFLANTAVTDAGVVALPQLGQLTRLRLAGTKITDKTLEALGASSKLQVLDVSGTAVTSAGAVALKACPALTDVNFYGAPVDDAACETLGGMTQLVRLNLDKTAVTDAGVAKLAGLTKLEFLHLGRTAVTDGCVETLAQMKSLKTLHVTRSQMTPQGAARLAEALPNCKLYAGNDLLPVRDTPLEPVNLIFDTDIGGDIDDAFALAIIHQMEKRGKCHLLAVTLTNAHPGVPNYVKVFNQLYGHDVPIGFCTETSGKGRSTDSYVTVPPKRQREDGSFVYPQAPEGWEPEPALTVLRRALAAAADNSVVIVQVGFSTNLAQLLNSPADDISPLTGMELAKRKVRLLSVMGGAFTFTSDTFLNHKEWNIIGDLEASKKVIHDWPGEIVFSGFEIGDAIRLSVCSLHNDFVGDNLVWDSYLSWCKAVGLEPNHDRPTWDLTSVLFVLRPETGRDYYTLSPAGTVKVVDDGLTRFTPSENGKHRCFITSPEQNVRVQEVFVDLCTQNPK